LKGQGRRDVTFRGDAVRALRGPGPADEVEPASFGASVRAHPALKADSVFGVTACRLRATGRAQPLGVGWVEVPRLECVVVFGGEESQESTGRQHGETRVWWKRIREGKKASKRMKLVVGSDPAAGGPGQPGSRLRPVKRELIVVRGSRPLRQKRGSR